MIITSPHNELSIFCYCVLIRLNNLIKILKYIINFNKIYQLPLLDCRHDGTNLTGCNPTPSIPSSNENLGITFIF